MVDGWCGADCAFENELRKVVFRQLGIRLHVLEPGQPSGLYHAESTQEAFLVLAATCSLLVEGDERLLRPWDFFHCPAWTEHTFVGAGDGPCVILYDRRALRRRGGGLPVVGACGALRRERRAGDDRPGASVCERRVVPARATAELGSYALGVDSFSGQVTLLVGYVVAVSLT